MYSCVPLNCLFLARSQYVYAFQFLFVIYSTEKKCYLFGLMMIQLEQNCRIRTFGNEIISSERNLLLTHQLNMEKTESENVNALLHS